MASKKIDCYLCSRKAQEEPARNTTARNFWVECENCGWYELTDRTIRFYLGWDVDLLNREDRLKLSEFVKKQYEKTPKLVRLKTDDIVRITSKKSISYRYR